LATLEVFWVNENPLAFYLTNKNGIGLVHLETKSKNNLELYKTVYKESVGLDNPYSVLTYNSLDINLKNPDENTERILYGISSQSDISKVEVNGIRMDGTDKLSYYLYNGYGDVVQTVSEDGEIENQYDYDIFGNPILTVENYQNSIRYAGEFYDAETGLYYLRARYYDPYIGRFISEDSYWGEDVNPLSLNLYTYCYNDPVQHITKDSVVLLEQIRTIDKKRLKEKIGHLSDELMKQVDTALQISFGLIEYT
jgi:RHS repeat-associated protein